MRDDVKDRVIGGKMWKIMIKGEIWYTKKNCHYTQMKENYGGN